MELVQNTEKGKIKITLSQADLSAADSILKTNRITKVWGVKREIKGKECPAQFFQREVSAEHTMQRQNFPAYFQITAADVKKYLEVKKN